MTRPMVRNETMESISLADAKAHLSAVIDRVEAGETISLTRRGKAVALIAPVSKPKEPFDWSELTRFRDTMPHQEMGAAELLRRMRNEEDGF